MLPWALLTGAFDLGLGRAAALPFLVINSAEALIAAWLLRRRGSSGASLASHEWVWTLALAAFLAPLAVAPLAVAPLVALTLGGSAAIRFRPLSSISARMCSGT